MINGFCVVLSYAPAHRNIKSTRPTGYYYLQILPSVPPLPLQSGFSFNSFYAILSFLLRNELYIFLLRLCSPALFLLLMCFCG